jgi:hypothetical protein
VLQPPLAYNGLQTRRPVSREGDDIANVTRRARTTNGARPQPRRTALALAIARVIGLAPLASGCGGSSGASVAQVGTTTGAKGSATSSASGAGDPRAYSACVRSNGVRNFPDPDSSGRIMIPTGALDKRSPAFQAAYRACRRLAPSGGSPQQQARWQEQLLAFATCMRSHDVPAFPDPQVVNGGIHLRVTGGQIDPNSPVVTAATAACRSKLASNFAGIRNPAEELVHGAAGLGNRLFQPTPRPGK